MRRTIPWLMMVVAGSLQAQTRITITLFDISKLDPQVRETMKKDATRIFLEAGVGIEWLDCEIAGKPLNLAECSQPTGQARLMLQLFPGENRTNRKTTGMAVIQGEASVFACLYPDRVFALARDAGWQFGELLGHAAAHEIGHLLLRSSRHSPAGIMRANWETEDLRKLSHAGLTFLPGQLDPVLTARVKP
jgi:hypothetical protein